MAEFSRPISGWDYTDEWRLPTRLYRTPLPEHNPHGDAGLQPERTILAWGRTTLSFSVVASTLMRWANQHGAPVIMLVGLAILGATMIQLSQHQRYQRGSEGIVHGATETAPVQVFAIIALIWIIGGTAITLILLD